jgi:hypothetical protein
VAYSKVDERNRIEFVLFCLAEMRLPPRHFPLVTLVIGLGGLLGLWAYSLVGSVSLTVIGISLVLIGVSLAVAQLYSGFSIPQGGKVVSRVDEPFLYWMGLFCYTVPFIYGGVVAICVELDLWP